MIVKQTASHVQQCRRRTGEEDEQKGEVRPYAKPLPEEDKPEGMYEDLQARQGMTYLEVRRLIAAA